MSTVRRPTDSRRPPQTNGDPYFYGFRHRLQRGPDGTKHMVTIPLTEDDVLHPLEGDHITQNTPHDADCLHLKDWFDVQLTGVPDAVVLHDCRVDFNLPGVRPLGPDLVVSRDVRTAGPWTTFSVHDEGARVVLVVEITSPSTRRVDLNEKRGHYWRAGVECYVIVDQVSMRRGVRQLEILAFERGRRNWRRLRMRRGRVWLDAVQLWLGVRDGRVVCWDAAGSELLPYAEAQAAAEQAQAATEQAQAAAEQAQAAAEQAQAAAEQAQAAAEERIRQLEEEVRRLRGE